jgi:hypothetical protein
MYKAKVAFSGLISMSVGDVGEIADASIAKDLLKAGYIEEIKPAIKGETEKSETENNTTNKKPAKGKEKRG